MFHVLAIECIIAFAHFFPEILFHRFKTLMRAINSYVNTLSTITTPIIYMYISSSKLSFLIESWMIKARLPMVSRMKVMIITILNFRILLALLVTGISFKSTLRCTLIWFRVAMVMNPHDVMSDAMMHCVIDRYFFV